MPVKGIQDFYTKAIERDFARDFQFRVTDLSIGGVSETDLVYITTASLPGKEISNQQVPFMGLDFNVPGSVKYVGSDAWTVQFRCDEAHSIRDKLLNAVNDIFSDETSTGDYGVPDKPATMILVGKDLEPVKTYTFHGMYPKSVGEMQYDIQGTGAPLTFDAVFAYQFWRAK